VVRYEYLFIHDLPGGYFSKEKEHIAHTLLLRAEEYLFIHDLPGGNFSQAERLHSPYTIIES